MQSVDLAMVPEPPQIKAVSLTLVAPVEVDRNSWKPEFNAIAMRPDFYPNHAAPFHQTHVVG